VAALRRQGARVSTWSSPDAAAETNDFPGLTADPRRIAALRAGVARLHGVGIDLLVLLPVPTHAAPLVAYPLDDWQAALDAGLTAPFILVRALLPAMLRRGFGRIVIVASGAWRGDDATSVGGAVVAGGGLALVRVIARATARKGVTAHAVVIGDGADVDAVTEEVVARCGGADLDATGEPRPSARAGTPSRPRRTRAR